MDNFTFMQNLMYFGIPIGIIFGLLLLVFVSGWSQIVILCPFTGFIMFVMSVFLAKAKLLPYYDPLSVVCIVYPIVFYVSVTWQWRVFFYGLSGRVAKTPESAKEISLLFGSLSLVCLWATIFAWVLAAIIFLGDLFTSEVMHASLAIVLLTAFYSLFFTCYISIPIWHRYRVLAENI